MDLWTHGNNVRYHPRHAASPSPRVPRCPFSSLPPPCSAGSLRTSTSSSPAAAIVDGTGAPWFRADVGIIGDRIAAIGNSPGARREAKIDAAGLVVAPGFIDLLGQSEFNVLVDARAAQQVTAGRHDRGDRRGLSIAPLNDRSREDGASLQSTSASRMTAGRSTTISRASRRGRKPAINLGTFVGAGGVRANVIGTSDRPASRPSSSRWRSSSPRRWRGRPRRLHVAPVRPDRFASTDELVALAKVAARYGGIYFTHQRSETGAIFESLDEVFADRERGEHPRASLALEDRLQGQLGPHAGGAAAIEAARAGGLDVTANLYPYTRASNGLDACLPLWVREGGRDAMLERLKDPAQRERIKKDMDDPNATTGRTSGSARAAGTA